MARKDGNVEFLNKLKDIYGHKSNKLFAKACKKTPQNIADYLSGAKRPGKKVLRSCLDNLCGWSVRPLIEVGDIPERPVELPEDAGVYMLYDSSAKVIYVGKATNFRTEVYQTLNRSIPSVIRLGKNLKGKKPKIKEIAHYLSLYAIPSPVLRHNFEVLLLRGFANQTHNSNIGHFK